MISCLDLRFWGTVATLAVLLRALPLRRTIGFGLWNCLGLALLGGWRLSASALVVTGLFWCVLRAAVALREKAGESSTQPSRKWLVAAAGIACLAVPIGLLAVYKIGSDWTVVRGWLGSHPRALLLHQLLVNLAFSYVFLRMIEMAHCVVWKGTRLLDLLSTAGYLFPFHMILSGPVARYDEHLRMNEVPPSHDAWLTALTGANHVATGLLYKYVVAEYVRAFFFGMEGSLTTTGWIDTALLFIYLFFDFAGYSRIMLGAGIWMGVPTPENFRAPFRSTTVTEFFTRWHISLGTFIQRNIYTPLQLTLVRRWGVRRALWAGLAALATAWLIVGIWHRFSLAFVVYGLTFGAVIWLEKVIRDRALRFSWSQTTACAWTTRLLGPVYVFVVETTMLHLVITEIMPT